MDPELRAYLEGMETRLRESFEARLRDNAESMEVRLREYTDQRSESMEARLREYTDQRSEMIETRLLRAFRNFSHPVEARLRVQKASTRAFNERLDAIEDRVEFLEGLSSNGSEPS